MDIKLEEEIDVIREDQLATRGIVTVLPSAQRRFDNIHSRDSEITKRLCYECGDIIAGGEDKYQDHTLLHEAVYIAYQVYHAERRSGPPKAPPHPTATPPSTHPSQTVGKEADLSQPTTQPEPEEMAPKEEGMVGGSAFLSPLVTTNLIKEEDNVNTVDKAIVTSDQ